MNGQFLAGLTVFLAIGGLFWAIGPWAFWLVVLLGLVYALVHKTPDQ